MEVHEIDPLTDYRWDDFVEGHSQGSIFHTRGWLEALRATYRYTPIAVTTSGPETPLTNGIPFCEISGFFGKRRLVSLPFSDHCQPLFDTPGQIDCVERYLRRKRDTEGWDYVEMRPMNPELMTDTEFEQSERFCFHNLDLRGSLSDISGRFHKSCVQRKIRRAERAALSCKVGTTESLLAKFYQLLVMTRRRQGLPVQPIEWFRNLINCLGDKACLWLASYDGYPIASIFTLRHKQTLVYKYGCSDRAFNRFGGMQLLLWKAIQDAKQRRLLRFDLGRTAPDNPGLITFKDRWGATKTDMTYLRDGTSYASRLSKAYQGAFSKYVWSYAPDAMVTAAGRALYRHLG